MNKLSFFVLLLIALAFSGCSKAGTLNPATTEYISPPTSTMSSTIALSMTECLTETATTPTPTLAPPATSTPRTPEIPPTPTATLPSPTVSVLELGQFGESWIAFASWAPEHGIKIVKAGGNGWSNVVAGEIGKDIYEEISWSPDGHWILFTMTDIVEGYDRELYVVKIDGTGLRRLTNNDDTESTPSWSPDGNTIAFSRNISVTSSELFLADRLGQNVRQLTANGLHNWFPQWSPDGKTIFFLSKESGEGSMWLRQIDAKGQKEEVVVQFPEQTNWLGGFSISPDGGRVVFRSDEGACGDLYMMDLDGINIKRLTDAPVREMHPSWSPDGRFIVYSATEECYENMGDGPALGWGLYVLDLKNGTRQKITNNDWVAISPIWSPVPALTIGETYTVTVFGDNLNLRETASLSGKVLRKLRTAEIVTVLEGPVDMDGYYWWRMRTQDGLEGWAVEASGWYTSVSVPLTLPTVTSTP